MALRNLGIDGHCSFEFCCDVDKWCKQFILQNSPPKQFFDDIKLRDPLAAPPCDLYVAGFPCQPFSRAGLRQGTQDVKGRGTIFDYILAYLRAHRPRAIILENVAGLHDKVFQATLNEMLAALRDIKGDTGQPHYIVSKRLVDTAKWGLPHSRKRVYIICMAKGAMKAEVPFRWPRPSAAIKPIDGLLQQIRGGDADLSAVSPKCRHRLLAYLNKLRARGENPDVDTWLINVFGRHPHGMKARSPCLTRSRAGAGGHWVSNRSRLLTIEEMLSLQGMRADVCREGISNRQMGLMIGNAMSVNVLERLLVRLLPVVGLWPPGSLQDKWG
jgi:site-specific DNA-cytosine methylase